MGNEQSTRIKSQNTTSTAVKPPVSSNSNDVKSPLQPKRRVGDKVSLLMKDGTVLLSTITRIGRRENTGVIAYIVSPDGYNDSKAEWVNEDSERISNPNWSTTHNQERVVRDSKRRPADCRCSPDFECVCSLIRPRLEAHINGTVFKTSDVAPDKPNVLINPALGDSKNEDKSESNKETKNPQDAALDVVMSWKTPSAAISVTTPTNTPLQPTLVPSPAAEPSATQ